LKLKSKKLKTCQICIRLEKELLAKIQSIANENKLTVTEAVRQIIENTIAD
jgi:predicted DNA-binding ribbon-helix-helix protein